MLEVLLRRRVHREAFVVVRTLGNLLRFCVLSGWMVGLCGGQEKQAQKVRKRLRRSRRGRNCTSGIASSAMETT